MKKPFNLVRLAVADSTNRYALSNFDRLDDKEVIIADVQTSGRGRRGRVWFSSRRGNIYMTIVLKPDSGAILQRSFEGITQYMSLVLSRVFEKYGVTADIKWPNDVQVAGKKVAGILCEASVRGRTINGIALGIGINLTLDEDELEEIGTPAIGLQQLLGRPVSRDRVVADILEEFDKEYMSVLENGFSSIKKEFTQRCPYVGRVITIDLPGGQKKGLLKEFDTTGALVLRTDTGEEEIVTTGDVQCL